MVKCDEGLGSSRSWKWTKAIYAGDMCVQGLFAAISWLKPCSGCEQMKCLSLFWVKYEGILQSTIPAHISQYSISQLVLILLLFTVRFSQGTKN